MEIVELRYAHSHCCSLLDYNDVSIVLVIDLFDGEMTVLTVASEPLIASLVSPQLVEAAV